MELISSDKRKISKTCMEGILMAELCMVCGDKMYVGEALRLSTPSGKHIGFVHRKCYYGNSDIRAKEGF